MKKILGEILKRLGIFSFVKRYKIRFQKRTRPLVKHYRHFIQPGNLCFDIGANVGNRTEIFWGLGSRVVAVEPQPSCIEILKREFNFTNQIIVVPKAIGRREGQGELSLCDETTVTSTMSTEWQEKGRFKNELTWSKKITVPVTTLDKLIETYGLPNYCKIDVEGFEEEVIAGLSQKIPLISFEFTREFFGSAERIISTLSKLGETSFNVTLGESHKLLFKNFVNKEELFKNLNERGEKNLWGDIYIKTI